MDLSHFRLIKLGGFNNEVAALQSGHYYSELGPTVALTNQLMETCMYICMSISCTFPVKLL